MDIRTLLTETKPFPPKRKAESIGDSSLSTTDFSSPTKTEPNSSKENVMRQVNMSKNVKFTLNNSSQSLNLNISPTDPPSAITSTVKDFFALHNRGISFTNSEGCILIITPDNLTDNMEIIVNQTGGHVDADTNNDPIKKKRKSSLSLRKKSLAKRVVDETNTVENNETDDTTATEDEEHRNERKERIFSAKVIVSVYHKW